MSKTARCFILCQVIVLLVMKVTAQNWETFGGNSARNGFSRITGPVTAFNQLWQVQSGLNTTLGMAVYSFGDRFVNSRTSFSPYTSRIECRDLSTGNLNWISPFISNSSILYTIGMTEDAVYAHDYDTDSVYALNLQDGSIKWRSPVLSHTFGAWPGCVFACNGDPILNGPVASSIFTMRLDKNSGDLVWSNNGLIVIGPPVALAASPTTVYRITGGITVPVRLTAIDINSGLTRYSSDSIPGDPDQEDPLIIGPDGIIYFWRDGGNLFAYSDDGSALVRKWMYVPSGPVSTPLLRNLTIGHGNTLYIFESNQVKRVDARNGNVLSSLSINIGSLASISVGADSILYLNDGLGTLHVYSDDLQFLLWQRSIPSGVYLNPPLCKEGTMVLTQAGSAIIGLRDVQSLAPVADFRSSSRQQVVGQPVDFFDQSSYTATSWLWQFPGSLQGSSTLQNPSGIVYSSAGTYPVTLTAQNALGGDSVTKNCYVEILATTGIQQTDKLSYTVFPNPAHDYIRLTGKVYLGPVPFKLIDMKGDVVMSSIIYNQQQVVDIGFLPAGSYILRIEKYGEPVQRLIKY
ncbi:MAG: PKD domain-containing protein [Bacteroidota bacterium]